MIFTYQQTYAERWEETKCKSIHLADTFIYLFSFPICHCSAASVCVWKRNGERGWDTGRATEELSTCNCSHPLSFLLPCYPLLMFSFVAIKKKKHQMKISQGFLVLMQDVRVTVKKPSPDSTPVSKLPCCWVHWGLPREKHLCLQPELSSMAEIKDRCTLPADQAERRTLTHADYCISWLWHPAATLREETRVCTFRFAFNHVFPLKCTSQG